MVGRGYNSIRSIVTINYKKIMPRRKVFHIVFKEKKWLIKQEGTGKPIDSSITKEKAIEKARKIAKKESLSQLKIHKKNGRIQEERTYGEDPEEYKG